MDSYNATVIAQVLEQSSWVSNKVCDLSPRRSVNASVMLARSGHSSREDHRLVKRRIVYQMNANAVKAHGSLGYLHRCNRQHSAHADGILKRQCRRAAVTGRRFGKLTAALLMLPRFPRFIFSCSFEKHEVENFWDLDFDIPID